MSDLEEMFKELLRCCLHEPVWTPDQVTRELKWIGDRQTGSESSSIVLVRLRARDGQRYGADYGLLVQYEDYTGHGCQCSSMTAREETLAKLLSHLDDYDLHKVIGLD